MNRIVLQSEHLSERASQWLAERCTLVICPYGDSGFHDALAPASGLVVRTYTRVDTQLLDAAPNLRVVGRAGAGLDHIDVKACRARGIDVVYTPDANTQAVVEYVVCLLGDALRPRCRLTRAVGPEAWRRLRAETCAPRQMNELALGILGLGRVGRRVAQVARAIGFRVLYNDLLDLPTECRHGAAEVPVERLFEESDIVTIHIDGRASNRGFVDAALLGRMKADAVLINTSRGFVVDTVELASCLCDQPHRRTFLDVHDPEPIESDSPLLGLPNAYLYPHLASRTETGMANMSWVVRDVITVLEGRRPEYPAPDPEL